MHNIQCNICIGLGSFSPFLHKTSIIKYIYYTKYDIIIIIIIYRNNYLVNLLIELYLILFHKNQITVLYNIICCY